LRLHRTTLARGIRALILTLAAAMAGAPLAWSQESPNEEYRLKAAFVYRFPQFVEWPESALTGRDDVTICVTRPNPFGALLHELIAGETLNGRQLVIRNLDRGSRLNGCQVLFMPAGTPDVKDVLNAVGSRPILTIGESPGFLEQGGVINLQVIDRRVRFEVSPGAAERVGLRLSSQLLRLAVRVRGAS
jgi:hypothetical protein